MTWSPTMPSDRTALTTLATDLRRLGLNRTADELNDRIAEATRKRWSATVLLEHLVADELEDKQRRSVESRLTRARLGRFKPLAAGIGNGPPRWTVSPSNASSPSTRRENVILVGAQGLGKTWRRTLPTRPSSPDTPPSSPPPPTCCSTSTDRRPAARSNAACATTRGRRCSSSMSSDTSPTTHAPPT